MQTFTEQEEIKKADFGRPHCILLGAGASFAAFPNGDKYGTKLPVMNNFIETLKLESFFDKAGFNKPFDNFEVLYAELVKESKNAQLARELEKVIYEYFEDMVLPDEPTLYDHLILSLREKDVIATFNWDPFLWQAATRNMHKTKLPKMFFLHGSVAIGVCHSCRVKTNANVLCPKCNNPVQKSKILYPITQKNYNNDSLIRKEWAAFRHYLKSGYIFTIFGYGAPDSDIEAVNLLSEAWGSHEKELEEIEIIDILDREKLSKKWDKFIFSHHYRATDSFYKSMIANHPRRSCEALWECLMMCKPSDGISFPTDLDFVQLYQYFQPRIEVDKT